jgi:hypothetical protein
MATNQSEYALHLTSPRGKKVVVLPKDEIPAWALKDITNPYVLGIDPDAVVDEDDDGDDSDGPPPESGPGSGIKAWRAYAEEIDVDTTGLDKPAIIEACKAKAAESDDDDSDDDPENPGE